MLNCGSVGVGSDYDGIEATPVGLDDVSKYPYLVHPSHYQL
jgi:microsomal dipeptidase-like Zn-dependent dipeptidase